MFTTEEADWIMATWGERAKKYKARKYDNENQQSIEGHLVQMLIAVGDGPGVGAYNKLILEKGEWFIGRKLAKEYPNCARFVKEMRPKMKECFYNAQMFNAYEYEPGAKYYEGFMCDGFIAVMHGWVVMPDGKVVDFTLEARDRFLKRQKSNRENTSLEDISYLGVHVPTEYINQSIVERKSCVVLAHMYHLNDTREMWIG